EVLQYFESYMFHNQNRDPVCVIAFNNNQTFPAISSLFIRMDQHFRLVFLFQDVSCSEFISEYSERKPRVLQFLSDLEKTAVKLDEMKLGADISGVTSSSVGAVGSVLSIIGLILAPFTAGASLGLTMTGAGLGITMGKSDVADTVVTGVCGSGEIAKDIISFIIDLREPKPMQSANEIEMVVQGAETTANEVQIANEAAARGAAALSMPVRAGFGVLNGLFLGLDIYNICKDSTSLHHGSKSEASEFIRARSALWRSELDSWQKIHDSLRQGLETSEKNKKILQKPFYPE
uniref:Uncharacterized protein n=1 Tax=Myripristis murdjan TaxID=586833 RepID=A0A667Z3T5_9TELE